MTTALMKTITPDPTTISEDARRVREALIEKGLETPLVHNGLTKQQKQERIAESFTDIASTLGLDLSDDSLCETPQRIARRSTRTTTG